jgi:hypothetical protein
MTWGSCCNPSVEIVEGTDSFVGGEDVPGSGRVCTGGASGIDPASPGDVGVPVPELDPDPPPALDPFPEPDPPAVDSAPELAPAWVSEPVCLSASDVVALEQ